MKKKLIIFCSLIISLCFSLNTKVYSYNVNDSNNPGQGTVDRESNGVYTGTSWTGSSLKAIRIRVFNSSKTSRLANDGYYFITDNIDNCKNKVNAKICETDSYNYSNVTDSTGASCNEKEVTLGCIVSNNLPSSWGLDFYNGTYLDNYLKDNGTYGNLKDILSGMGYDDSNFQNTDVVIVEPVTFVTCAGELYFGTSTALMKTNVSYRGSTNNKCAADDNVYGGKYVGYTFTNVFRNMSTAFKIDTAVSYATEEEKSQNEFFGDSNNTKASGFGFFLYNVSGMGYNDTDGDLKIQIKYGSQLITSDNATFRIYSGGACNGDEYVDEVITSSGQVQINLPLGQYTVCQVSYPNGYNETPISTGGKKQTDQLTTSGKTFTFLYSKNSTCESELSEYSSPTPIQLFSLYKKYNYNGLLDLSNPRCEYVSCTGNPTRITGCLAATSDFSYAEDSNFNAAEPNLSCFDVMEAGDNYVFCNSTAYTLTNNFPVSKFYGKNGNFLIKKDSSNSYIYYNSNFEKQSISSAKGIATAKRVNVCYSINPLTSEQINNYVKLDATDFEKLYFGMNDYTGYTDNLNSTGRNGGYNENLGSTLNRYRYTYYVDYDFLPFYFKKITGEYRNIRTQWTTSEKVYGLLSKFNDEKEGEIPFQLGNLKPTKDELKCWYELKPEIIVENKLQLEFRTIDTSQPFNRNTKSNWCDGTDCAENNSTVQTYITNQTNSYGFKNGSTVRQQPIYKIILTPSDIKLIREYNKDHPYDNYNIHCWDENSEGVVTCRNAFLQNLKKGFLRKYEYKIESGIGGVMLRSKWEEYGKLSHILETDRSFSWVVAE